MNDHSVFHTPRTRFVALALGAAALLATASSAQDPQLRLYRDAAAFENASNAMQNLLIARFGPRPLFDEKGNPITATASGPLLGSLGSSFTASGSQPVVGNVLVNNAAGDATAQDTQSETALVLGSGSNVISAFNDSGSFLGTNHFTGWAFSSNSGSSWTDPGVLPGSNDAGDPVLARDNLTGRIYLVCLFFSGSGINCFRSDDEGATWLPSVNAAPSNGAMDKEWVTVDNFPGPGNGNVYLITRDFGAGNGIFFFRSTDQGSSFTPFGGTLIASGSPANVQGAYIVVTPDHVLHAFWYDSNAPATIRTRSSNDQGLTWGAPVVVTGLTSTFTNGGLSLVAGFRSNSFPSVAVNPVSGAMYCVYNDPVAVSGGDRGNIKLRQSTDGGATWSAAMTVNDDATLRAQYFPTIACRPDGTGLAVCWYDNRNDPMDVLIERWGVTASIAGSVLTFGPNFRLSPQFPPIFGVDPVVNSVYMGDYDQMVADNTAYYTTWGDQRDNSIAVPTRKNANVRFTSFDQAGPGALVGFGGFLVNGGNGNGRIDQNECNDVLVTLNNDGAQPATGLMATLTTTTPGVTILNDTQAYPDLGAGESQQGLAPFQVSTQPGFNCAVPIDFTLTVTFDAGIELLPFATEGSSNYLLTVGSGTLIPGTTDIGNHGDDVTTTIALPFPVTFYGTTYNQIALSSNGVAQFTGASSAFSNTCLPTATFSDAILAHWDDQRTDGAGEGIFTATTGVAPNREFHIDFRTHYFSGGGTARFELRLHEDTSAFEIVFATVGQGGSSATVGCEEGGGLHSTQHSCNQGGAVGAGTQLNFELAGCPDGGGSCGNPSTPVVQSVTPNHGPNTGLGGVVILGSGFSGTTSVAFGSDLVPFVVNDDGQITAAPGATSATGYVDVSVTNAGGTGTLLDGFDFFTPPSEWGSACSTPTLTWSGSPTIGEKYTVTTQNLGGASQFLLVEWSNLGGGPHARRNPSPACPVLLRPDMVLDLGTSDSHTFTLPLDVSLIGVHLRTQAQIVSPAATTQVLDAKIGE